MKSAIGSKGTPEQDIAIQKIQDPMKKFSRNQATISKKTKNNQIPKQRNTIVKIIEDKVYAKYSLVDITDIKVGSKFTWMD